MPNLFLNHGQHFDLLKKRLKLQKAFWRPEIIESWAAVHLVLAFDENNLKDGLRIAMIRRTEKPEDPWSGHYAFPGGRVEEGESLLSASRRETFEEVGLTLEEKFYLGEFFHMQLFFKGEPLPYAISSHVSYLPCIQEMKACPDEVAEAFWFSLSDLHHLAHVKNKPFKMSQGTRELPCLEFSGHTIWGISYLILRELYNQLHGLPFHGEKLFSKDILPNYPYGNALDEK